MHQGLTERVPEGLVDVFITSPDGLTLPAADFALFFNDLIPVYQQLGVEYAESNVELETNVSVQSQWEYFHREHHKTRRSYIKKLINDDNQQTEK